MATSEQKRQAKLAKKKAKDRQRHKAILQRQQTLASVAGQMQAMSKGEIIKCMASPMNQGMGSVIFARRSPRGQIAFMVLLLDTYLLGVKDAFGRMDDGRFDEMVTGMQQRQELHDISPGRARGLVEAAIAYARQFGFEPHADYRKCEPLWGDVVAESVEGEYTFGKDGKPTYVSGPESPERANFIVNRLQEVCGPDNFHYVVGGPMMRTDSMHALEGGDYDLEDDFDDDSDDELNA